MIDRLKDLETLLRVPNSDLTIVAERLALFEALVQKWNPAINIVARSALTELWSRHILDSVQIFRFRPAEGLWLDLGSGGGFPGIVLAILAKQLSPEVRFRLVESDQRKSVFLRECCRQLGLSADILTERIENLEAQNASVVSARALAPLSVLCEYAFRHMVPSGVAVFLKGQQSEAEITEAGRFWKFDLERHASVTSKDASILMIRGLHHV